MDHRWLIVPGELWLPGTACQATASDWLVQGLKVKVLVVQSSDSLPPMDCSQSGSSVCGVLQARILEWVALPFSREISPTQGSNPGLLHWRRILYHWATNDTEIQSLPSAGDRSSGSSQPQSSLRFWGLTFGSARSLSYSHPWRYIPGSTSQAPLDSWDCSQETHCETPIH